MVRTWGFEVLRSGSGVIDVGGEPGFVAAALLKRGIPTSIVDPSWKLTGKTNRLTAVEQMAQMPGCPPFKAYKENFDDRFVEQHKDLVDGASAIVSLYGDEATEPSLKLAATLGKPCAVIPCNECMRFFPTKNQTYDGYVQACLDDSRQWNGFFELVNLVGAPFSRSMIVQSPRPTWAQKVLANLAPETTDQRQQTLEVPLEVSRRWEYFIKSCGRWRRLRELGACKLACTALKTAPGKTQMSGVQAQVSQVG